jgi:hypothetical protein
VKKRAKSHQRVLDVDPPRMEISFSRTGEFRGVETTVTVTYWSILRSGGAMSGRVKEW